MPKSDASIDLSTTIDEVVSDKKNGWFLSKMVTMTFVTYTLKGIFTKLGGYSMIIYTVSYIYCIIIQLHYWIHKSG